MIYLIGSLRTPVVPLLGRKLRLEGFKVFDDWHSAGPHADDEWQKYETLRGRSYAEALKGAAANNVFDFDYRHLEECNTGILVAPAGKSAHLELGWMLGQKKRGYILFDKEPERWDVMVLFASGRGAGVFFDYDKLLKQLKDDHYGC